MKSYRANEARLKMREILTDVEHGEHVQIQRYDTPTAIVVPVAWWRNMLAIKRGLLLFTRDSETCHQLPGETEKPIGELLAAIGNDALRVLDEEPDLGDER